MQMTNTTSRNGEVGLSSVAMATKEQEEPRSGSGERCADVDMIEWRS